MQLHSELPHMFSRLRPILLATVLLGIAACEPPRPAETPTPQPGLTSQATGAKPSQPPPVEQATPRPPADLPLDEGAELQRYEFREEHDPEGTGKFYMGREIAPVMGFGAVDWLERPERNKEEDLTKLVDELKLEPGMVAADIGAGSGVITMMMSPKVAPDGKVLAIDVQQEMLDALEKKLKDRKIDNIVTILGTPQSPQIKPGTVDVALMVDVYHEFEWPHEMLADIAAALKPGGRLVFIEYRKEDPKVLIKQVHKMTQEQVKKEASLPEFKLKWKQTIDSLPQQHMIIFEKQPD